VGSYPEAGNDRVIRRKSKELWLGRTLDDNGGSEAEAFLNGVSRLLDVVSSVQIPRAYIHIYGWVRWLLTRRGSEDEERVEHKSESGGIQDS
jgi:hypothetical protein